MNKIIETQFGTLFNPDRVARGSASPVIKQGAFYVFSIKIDLEDVREYSFTDRTRAEKMREILISHLAERLAKRA